MRWEVCSPRCGACKHSVRFACHAAWLAVHLSWLSPLRVAHFAACVLLACASPPYVGTWESIALASNFWLGAESLNTGSTGTTSRFQAFVYSEEPKLAFASRPRCQVRLSTWYRKVLDCKHMACVCILNSKWNPHIRRREVAFNLTLQGPAPSPCFIQLQKARVSPLDKHLNLSMFHQRQVLTAILHCIPWSQGIPSPWNIPSSPP